MPPEPPVNGHQPAPLDDVPPPPAAHLVQLEAVMDGILKLSDTVQGLVTKVAGLEGTHNVAPPAHVGDAVAVANAMAAAARVDLNESADSTPPPQGDIHASQIVNVKVLRDNSLLQTKVSERLLELSNPLELTQDPSNTPKGKRSGRNKTVHDVIVKDVVWPHYHVQRTCTEKPVTFDDLTLPEFVNGTLKAVMATESMSPMAKIQLNHLAELMGDAEDFAWPTLRQYHGVILQDLEMGRYSWEDQETFSRKKVKHVSRAEAAARRPRHHSQPSSFSARPMSTSSSQVQSNVTQVCKAYNLGECNAPSPHSSSEGLVRHCCAFCKKNVQRYLGHTEKSCRRKSENMSKN